MAEYIKCELIGGEFPGHISHLMSKCYRLQDNGYVHQSVNHRKEVEVLQSFSVIGGV